MKFKPLMAALTLCLAGTLAPVAQADSTTYTVEPWDFDGVTPLWTPALTQAQLGGSRCPCEKIQYPATGLPQDNQKGADAIWALVQNGTIKSGDTILGFSLGTQVISLFMSQHQLPAGVRLILCGDTLAHNQQLVDAGQGVPWNTPNPVTMIANEYDGWSDQPDIPSAPGYGTAWLNALIGSQQVHNYTRAQPDDPANVVTTQDQFTAILVPNQNLPLPNGDRSEIDGAYSRSVPTQGQLDAAGGEQVDGGVSLSQPAEAVAPQG